jgi:hypothetical protein
MTGEHSRLHDAVDEEIAEIEASADAADNDEPEREALEIRLHNLHEAVVALEGVHVTRHESAG